MCIFKGTKKYSLFYLKFTNVFFFILIFRGTGPTNGSIFGSYDEAVWHGQEGHDCSENYYKCNSTAQKMMQEFKNHNNSTNFIL